ncbi:MAG: 16S rRNA (cytosine(1402)-N(4))-methyltransferase RsmH, partial [Burkholderiales bacterium]|nr:16S rRNA (cytosine(1402)-N(4))-methyltransferase RsmH [Burkholderiales bacterium]
RMDTTRGKSVKEWVNQASVSEIDEVLYKFGEERFHKKIAEQIVKSRVVKPIDTTTDLVKIIEQCVIYKEKGRHCATRSFQAMRIFINNELSDLETILDDITKLLKVNGRVVIISFHSLEDRIVKNYFNLLSKPKPTPKWIMVDNESANYQIIAKKIKADLQELNQNVRSRSAIMRSLERLK